MESPFSVDGDRLVRQYDSETLWVEPWGSNSLRVRATKLSRMPDADWALLPPEPGEARISIEGGSASISNGAIRAEVSPEGRLAFYGGKGELLLHEYVRNWDCEKNPSAMRVFARELAPIPGGDYKLTARFESVPDERIYGLGQYQQPFMDMKNCSLELAQRNSQVSVPFALSSLGYGFLWNNPAIGRVSLGKNLSEWTAHSTKQLDYWICAGESPAEIEEAYAKATGTAPMMPEYGMGFWQCKLRYRTQEELLGVAREYKRRGLPISVIVIDFFHWIKQGDWSFDPEFWPDPEAMVAELKALGIELMVSIWPTVDLTSANYREMLQKGYLVRVDRGVRTTMQFCGDTVFYDATNPGARDFLWKEVKKNYYDKGIRLFWLDEAEPEYSAYDFDTYRYFAGTDLEVGNLYPAMHAKAFYDGMRAAGQEEIVNLVRCAWAGSQRYGALVWSGDIHSSFASLRDQVKAGLNMGLAGIPWWTTDIGGFFGGKVDDPDFRELLVRWFQYGAFCPVFRIHGDRLPQSPPLAASGPEIFHSGAANEVWTYGEEALGIFRKYMLLREGLKPYIRLIMRAAHEKGTPPMRPLFYDFPRDPAAWEIEDQFMFGPDILVAPILEAGARSRKVYLPEGATWKDANGSALHEGGRWIDCEAPLAVLPLFLRNAAALGVNFRG